MSYTVPFPVSLGDEYAGLTNVFALLIDQSFDPFGTPQIMNEVDSGFYACLLDVPDDFLGYVKAYSVANPGDTLALGGVDPTLNYISDVVDGLSGGTGAYATLLEFFETSSIVPIPDVEFTVSISGAVITFGQADVTGQKTVFLDPATYTLQLKRTGVAFDVETLVVTADGTHTFYGTPATTEPPIAADECHIYVDVRGQSSGVLPATVPAKAKIIELPHESGDQYFSGEDYDAAYDTDIGRLSWRIVRGATAEFRLPVWYNLNGTAVVPDQYEISLQDLLKYYSV